MNEEVKNNKITRLSTVFSLITAILAVLSGAAYIFAACHLYFTGGDNPYTRERVGEYLLWLLPISLLLLISVIATAFLGSEKEKIVGKKGMTHLGKSHPRALLAVRISVAVLASALIIFGIFAGGMTDVLGKAVKICTECIGLG